MPFSLKTDPMATDVGRWGHSLANLAEIFFACLDIAAPSSVIEVGAYAGDTTRLLVEWGAGSGVRIWSIDPDPQPALVELAESHAELELVRDTSLAALPQLPAADAVIIDGDHNYYTVSEELRLVAEQASGGPMPLLLCHDVCWPHARRDVYYAPDRIPAEDRQPGPEGGYVFPGQSGLHDGGLVYRWPAEHEGGPRNGVLTAIEDFLSERDDLQFALVPAFFGLGIIWPRSASYDDDLTQLLANWDRNPVVARLEENRVLHLASWNREGARFGWCNERSQRMEAVLRKLLQSRTFDVAIALSRLRQRGEPAFSKEEIRRALEV